MQKSGKLPAVAFFSICINFAKVMKDNNKSQKNPSAQKLSQMDRISTAISIINLHRIQFHSLSHEISGLI
jgi:hypothetical protein